MFVFQSFSEPPRMGSQKIQNDDLSDAKNGFAQIDKTVKNYTSGRMDSLVRMINQHIDRLSAASPGANEAARRANENCHQNRCQRKPILRL